ncbi:amidase [Labrys sp. WJW]|uniref:amidase n=1 Tax=Labrys sp. WJW TaxID=1737983 RepID=UPI00082BD61E|nr:amidase [Labrys sp. WJW]OCC05418.1 amidase [Labrys sp. WJW]
MTSGSVPSSLRALRRNIATRVISPSDLAETCLRRARRLRRRSHAYITLADDTALRQARALERREHLGALSGIPYACKDVFDTIDLPTTAGSQAMADYHARDDAGAIRRLREAGAVLIGKTNLHEFSYGITGENATFGTPPNPHDENYIAGGSSSGSAVAVAQGSAVFALGTDTGGSVRVPAALCGLVGLKPTMGLIGTQGVIPFCWSLDHVGLITRSCIDALDVLEVLARQQGTVPQTEPSATEGHDREANALEGLRIGVPRPYFFDNADPEIIAAVDRVLIRCQDLGARLVPLPVLDMDHVRTASLAIQLVEAFAWHKSRLKTHTSLYGEDVRDGLLQGQFVLAEHYVQALRFMEAKRLELDRLFRSIDVMITPTTPIVAPRLGARSAIIGETEEPVGNALARFTCLFNLTGHPALSVPIGRHSTRLPIGLQMVGRPFEDRRLLSIGHMLERVGLVRWRAPSHRDDP